MLFTLLLLYLSLRNTVYAYTCSHGSVRVSSFSYGAVEVCFNNTWGSICTDFWDNNDASVVCKQLGYSPYGAVGSSLVYYSSSATKHNIVDLNCTGNENTILDCPYNGLSDYYCSLSKDANIFCESLSVATFSSCADGDVHLVGGASKYQGRVEVCLNRAWGTVCASSSWGSQEAKIICNQIGALTTGYSYGRVGTLGFSQGTGPTLLGYLNCNGTEANLVKCNQNYQYTHTNFKCQNHYYDGAVICDSPCKNRTIRLYSESGSYYRRYGRVHVCVNNVWGIVCDDFWDDKDASVVCRMLGYSSHGASAQTNAYTAGEWYVHINDLNCTGEEESIWDCPQNGLSGHSCYHYQDASVICQLSYVQYSNCTTGEIRLTDGETQYEGRVEVCINGVWGTVCDNGWDTREAYAVCHQLGYQGTGYVYNSYFGISPHPILIFYTSCSSYQNNLFNCYMNQFPYLYPHCNNYQEAGVKCESPCTDGEMSLYFGVSSRHGNVRVCIDGTWSKVCGYGNSVVDDNLASVICSELGYSPYGAKSSYKVWNDDIYPYSITNVQCYGNETKFTDCHYEILSSSYCRHYYFYYSYYFFYGAVTILCQKTTIEAPVNCTEGEISLYGGSKSNEGILHMCTNGAWGTVCLNSYWSNINANVACYELGYSAYGNTYDKSWTEEKYPMIYTRFDCFGSETRLSSCYSFTSSIKYCSKYQVVKLKCQEPYKCTTGDVQLYGGSYYYGAVQVCVEGVWGSVCQNTFWDNNDASVVCKQLGFSPYGSVAIQSTCYNNYYDPTFFTGLNCNGSEDHLFNCAINTSAPVCSSTGNDANVICPVYSSTYSNCTDGQVRLFGGSTDYEGTVEICINHAWGTIYDKNGWGYEEAQTVCNTLGYTVPGAQSFYNAYFGKGTGPILLYYVYCSSPTFSLLYCDINSYYYYSSYNNHINDAGVRCQTFCQHGDIRLVGSSNPLIGRVEVCVNNTWGTICDDYWDNNDASVVCRQLGFPGEGALASTGSYRDIAKSFHIIGLKCNGTEQSLFNCSCNNIQQHSHYYYEDAYVQCPAQNTTDNCTSGEVRLVDGVTEYEGRIDLCYSGAWGSVCPNLWNSNDAKVVCRQLGYNNIGAAPVSKFGKGVWPFYFSSFHCSGTESNLLSCTYYIYSWCSYSYHAGVKCETPCTHGDVRLKGDSRYNNFGRVEVCVNGTWGTICDDYWDNTDASVICRQLGFSPYGAIAKTTFYRENSLPHTIFNMSCKGDEATLFNCVYSEVASVGSNCYNYEDATVICQDLNVTHSNCTDYDVQLVDGPSLNEGRVIMCMNGVWGILCNNGIDYNYAGVVCLQLGYQRGIAYTGQFPNAANDMLLVTDITCSNTATTLSECTFSHFTKTSTCDAKSIFTIKCHNCTDGNIKIIPYDNYNKQMGRIEVCVTGTWGTVCSDFFDDNDAKVACRQLRYSHLGSISISHMKYEDVFPHHFIDVNCTGNELRLFDCPHNGMSDYICSSSHVAAIACFNDYEVQYANCIDGETRLSGGPSSMNGQTEICYNNVWFRICTDDYNSYNKPSTICEVLGYSYQDSTGYYSSFLDSPTLPFIPYEFRCNGTEQSLLDCIKHPISCYSSDSYYRGFICQTKCHNGKIRLTGTSYSTIGRVELCLNGTWGTICSNSFDDKDASVVCRQLGYSPYGAIPLPNYYNNYYHPSYIYNLNCTGVENNIWDCPYDDSYMHYCKYNAAVMCQYTNTVDTSCNNGDVRLVGGINELEGRVEICYNKIWGSVCHNSWDTYDANVVCKQLGYQPIGATALWHSYFGHGEAPHILNNVECSSSGSYNSLLQCSYNALDATLYCGDSAVASVICVEPCIDDTVRLSGSTVKYAGRVEICIETRWTSLCDQSWDFKDAQVVCRELGYSPFGAVPTYNCYTKDQLSFGITDINCTGLEEHLVNCSHSNAVLYNCNSCDDAGVVCQVLVEQANCANGEVRLVGGSSPQEGIVEVCVNEVWGTVCSNSWSIADVNVVCRQLGYLPIEAKFRYFGSGSGPILLSDLYCFGTELSLLECNQTSCDVTSCTHSNDAGVICERPCTDGHIRLGDGAVFIGRVEVCINGTWGTICDHHWTQQEASVVCSHLGYSPYGSMATTNLFLNNQWPIGMFELRCLGKETKIWDCISKISHEGHNCGQYNDASVFCMPNTTVYSNCSNGDVRLVGGNTNNKGNVQICYNNAWCSVCDENWGMSDSNVVCRQLGFQPYESHYYNNNHFGVTNNPSYLYGTFFCSGSEQSLINCSRSYNNLINCGMAGVHCVVIAVLLNNNGQHISKQKGQSVSFNCTADGDPRSVIVWRKNGQLLLNTNRITISSTEQSNGFHSNYFPTTSVLTITDLRGSDNGRYSCRIKNVVNIKAVLTTPYVLHVIESSPTNYCLNSPCGKHGKCQSLSNGYVCDCSSGYNGINCEQVVTIYILPKITQQSTNISGNLYSTVNLTCRAIGIPIPTILWYKDNVFIPNDNNDPSILMFSELNLKDRGFYQCEARSLIKGNVISVNSSRVILNITDVVQYKAVINILEETTNKNVSEIIQDIIDQLSNLLSGNSVAGFPNSHILSIQLANSINYIAQFNTVPIVISLITKNRASEQLRIGALKELATLSEESNVNISLIEMGRFDGCPATNTTIPSHSSKDLSITLSWPEVNIGVQVMRSCPCGNKSSEGGGILEATRYCGGDFINGAMWAEPNIAACNFSDLTRKICALRNAPVTKKVEQLKNLTSDSSRLGSTEVIASVSVLVTATEDVLGNLTLSITFLEVVGNMLDVNQSTLDSSQKIYNSSAKMLEAVESVVDSIPIINISEPIVIIQKSFAVSVQQVDTEEFTQFGLTFSIRYRGYSDESQTLNSNDLLFGSTSQQSAAVINLPNNLLSVLPNITKNNTRITHSVFTTDSLFLRRNNYNLEVGSVIISTTVVGTDMLSQLDPPVELQFLVNPNLNGSSPQCSFWNQSLDNGYGDWSKEGCHNTTNNKTEVVCECNHLTNFAILLDVVIDEPTEGTGQILLMDIMTYSGIIVSLNCLIITIISYIASKTLRTSDHGQLLLNLCFAFLGLYIAFILAKHGTIVPVFCAVIAASLQYFFLVTFMVMAAMAINLYMSLVIVLGKRIRHFVLKATMSSWITPLLIVLFCFAPNYKNYLSDHFCRALNEPYYIGMVVPFLIIYIFNWAVFIIIIISLLRRNFLSGTGIKRKNKINIKFVREQLTIVITLSVTLGLGWGIGLIDTQDIHTNKTVQDVFAALFIIIIAFHGLFIFIMQCLRSKKARNVWKRCLFNVSGKNFNEVKSAAFSSRHKKHLRMRGTLHTTKFSKRGESLNKTALKSMKLGSKLKVVTSVETTFNEDESEN